MRSCVSWCKLIGKSLPSGNLKIVKKLRIFSSYVGTTSSKNIGRQKDLILHNDLILIQHRMLLGLWSQPVLCKRSWMRNISGSARATTRPLKNGQWIATIGDGSCVRFAAELSRMRRCPITVAREVQTGESVPIVHEMVVANPHSWLDIIRMMVYY